MQDDNPAASTAHDIKAAARDMLRMGSRWAHSALDWIDERRTDMNNRSRDERDFRDHNRYQQSTYGESQDRERSEYNRQRHYGGRSDRDIQSDFSGSGYDQVGGRDYRGGGSDWRGGYGREGSYPQSRTLSPDDSQRSDRYDSDFGYGSGHSGYGAGSPGAGGVGYGAPGYGAGTSYGATRYRGDFQNDRDWLRDEGEGFSGDNYNAGMDSQYGSRQGGNQYGAYAREGRHSHESYGQYRGGRQQDWRARGTAGQGYGERGYESGDRDYRMQGYGYGSQGSQQGSQSSQAGRSYRGLGPRNYTRSDERIREDLNERLTDAHDIDASGISVEVNNGVATLNGTVSERWMKHRAEDIADGCSGVRDVRNMIQVTSQSQGSQSQGSQSHGSQGASGYGSQGTSQSQASSGYGSQHGQSGGSHAQGSTGASTSQGSASSQGSSGSSGAGGSSLGASSGSSQYGGSSSGSQAGSGSQHGSSGSSSGSRGPNV